MIKLKHIQKYYNKNRSNEIHVINDTSIDFPKTGLVAITGPSGCGKTTLLNVIAGLDSFKSGEITYDDVTVNKYKSSVVDATRNQHIGFIFQNYHLLPDKTVYDNIKTSLNLAGLYDKDLIEERINYSLEQVGMYNYRKRSVLALSGGQQQRVGIARAIAKNPNVILADEPTGNLDSNNTFAIMSLIKNISQTKLVILVTHERHLVDFYADRIIELKDGSVVNDYQNFNDKSYNHQDERLIYLKDMESENLETDFLEYYYASENKKQFKIKVVEMNDTLYIQTNAHKKVKIIDDQSEIKLINDHKKEVKIDDLDPLDFDSFEPIVYQHKKSLFRWRDTFLSGLKKFFVRRKFGKKLLIAAYFVISGLIALQLSSLGNLIRIDETQFSETPNSFISVDENKELTRSEYLDIMATENVDYPYGGSNYFNFFSQPFYQLTFSGETYAWVSKVSWLTDTSLLRGELPEGPYEIVITTRIFRSLMDNNYDGNVGISKPEDMIGVTVKSDMSEIEFEIVGVQESNERMVVVSDMAYARFANAYINYSSLDLYQNDVEIVTGRLPQANNEIIVLDEHYTAYGNDIVTLESEMDGSTIGTYNVVGTFDMVDGSDLNQMLYLLDNDAFEKAMVYETTTDDGVSITYYGELFNYFATSNKEEAISALDTKGFEATDVYQTQLENYIANRNLAISSRLASLFVIIGGVVLYIYFVMRTSMISRVKEIGIYRAIGASKRDVYKIFLSEILVYTTLASLTGYLLSSYILRGIENQVGEYFSFFYLPLWLFAIGLAGIYVVNVVFGILPVFNLLRRTPAEILAKYDI